MKERTPKEIMLEKLAELPDMVVSASFLYAKNYIDYGCDVTKEWTSAVENHDALSRAYSKGYYDAMKKWEEYEAEIGKRIESGTDGNPYELSMSTGVDLNSDKSHACYTLSRNKNRCDVCGAYLNRCDPEEE